MKKLIIFVLVTILVISLLGACCETHEVIDKEPIDVRYTEAHDQLVTSIIPISTGKTIVMVPNYYTVHHDEKWEIKWLLIYDDESKTTKWLECSEEDYYIIKEYLDSGSCEGFRGLGGDSDE